MKIAFVVHDYRKMEGHSRYVVELASRFRNNHEVHVYANRIDDHLVEGINYHHVPACRMGALASILSFACSASFVVPGGFDIIHNQGLCGWKGNVVTAHICNRAWHRALRESKPRLTLKEWISGNTLSMLEQFNYSRMRDSHVIAVSSRVADDLRSDYSVQSPINVIPHGVDLDTFNPGNRSVARSMVRQQLGINNEDFVFLYVGDLRKGAQRCILALSRLSHGKLVLISRSCYQPFWSVAKDCGVADRVFFLGARHDIEQYYAASDAFLLPTHYDSFGMVVTEAMASGLPVVVSQEAGASELILSGENGFLLRDFNDLGDLSQKMSLLLTQPSLAHKIGAAARRTVEAYSWDGVAAQTMGVYQMLLKARLPNQLN